VVVRPAAGGGRWVEVAPERLIRWTDGFVESHGVGRTEVTDDGLLVCCEDGTQAQFHLPFGWPGQPAAHLDALITAATTPRRFALLLARQASTAAAIVEDQKLVTTTVRSRYVQGRTAAGGSSQQRYARRRGNQAQSATRVGAEAVANLLLPATSSLNGLVTGGDRRAVEAVLADPRLVPLGRLRVPRFLQVGEPRRPALAAAVPSARAVRVRLHNPEAGEEAQPDGARPRDQA
jgi:hypothetical protein